MPEFVHGVSAPVAVSVKCVVEICFVSLVGCAMCVVCAALSSSKLCVPSVSSGSSWVSTLL